MITLSCAFHDVFKQMQPPNCQTRNTQAHTGKVAGLGREKWQFNRSSRLRLFIDPDSTSRNEWISGLCG